MTGSLKTKTVLDDAKEDLKNAEFVGFPGKLVNPIFDHVLAPITEKASDIVPAIVDAIPLPFTDEIAALSMTVPFAFMKLGYSILPHAKELDHESETVTAAEFNAALNAGKKKRRMPILSQAMGAVGFFNNTILDLATLPFRGDLGQWISETSKLRGYLVFSGVGGELLDAFLSPGSLSAMIILGRIQKERNVVGDEDSRRSRVAMKTLPSNIPDKDAFKSVMTEAAIYTRYASAAYGAETMKAAKLLQNVNTKTDHFSIFQTTCEMKRLRKISKYVGVPVGDIIVSTPPGGDSDILGHIITVDRRMKAIVLALRGTYTISGVKTDLQFFSKKFCNGVAHEGIADRADKIWDEVKDTIKDLLIKNSEYEFIITGHSLGAGTAALLSLKLNHEGLDSEEDTSLANRTVRCFAFAPPPVYYIDDDDFMSGAMKEAMKNTYAFIHARDVVPFCSVASLRDVSMKIDEVNDKTNPIEGPLIVAGIKGVPKELKDAVFEYNELPYTQNADKLAIPSPCVIWMRKTGVDKKGDVFNAMFCRPEGEGEEKGLSDLTIYLGLGMVTNHMPPGYENCINSVVRSMLGKDGGDGFVFPG